MNKMIIFAGKLDDMNYLEKAVNDLVYYTPKKVVEKIKLHLIIKNPPYEPNRQTNPNKRG